MRTGRIYVLPIAFLLFALTPTLHSAAQELRKRSAVEVRQVPDSVVQRMQKDPEFRYANDSSYWQKERAAEPGGFSRFLDTIARSAFLKVVLYIVLAIGIIFAIYQVMVANNFFIISRKKRRRSTGEADAGDMTYENLDERILEEVNSGNYRQAVRYMYLKTLKLLSDYNFITLHAKSTNQDYVRQMNNHRGLGQFRQLTRIYEYVWYGEFDPSDSQFEIIRSNFNKFNPQS